MKKTDKHRTFWQLLILMGLLLSINSYEALAQCKSIIDVDFNKWDNRRYSIADVKNDFNNRVKPWTASTYRGVAAPGAAADLIGDVAQETRIVNGELRAEYKKNDAGGYAGGFLFDPYFDGVEEAYLEYKVKFDDNFFWATGGKLPGLGGSSTGINSETTGRGTIPSGCKYNTNGWSARLMWRRNRAQTTQPYLILYSYFAEKEDGSPRQDGDCGDAKRIYTGLNDNTWYTIRQYIKLNTPGQKNGTVIMWINGEETYRDTKAMIRNTGKNSLKINALIMNTYRGGSRTDPVWHSPRDEYAFFDDFKVWTGCSNPPNTGTPNKAPIGTFVEPTIESIEEGYNKLYVLVDATDPDGDEVSTILKIDGVEIRKESVAPFEWGHISTNQDFTNETLGLSAGVHLLEVVINDSKGAETTIKKTITVTEEKGPFNGTFSSIPGTIEVENFDEGGQGVSYNDTDPENKGADRSGFRIADGVDVDNGNGGKVVGWTSNGEWLEYSVNVVSAGSYDFDIISSSLVGGGIISLTLDNILLIPTISLSETGSWDEYEETTIAVNLPQGNHVIRLGIVESGINLDKIVFRPTVVTAAEESFDLSNQIYPNPSSDGLFHLSQESIFQVFSITGEFLFEGKGTEINLSDFPSGIYLIQSMGVNARLVK